jgi:predicted metal-dependent hydrolase
LADERPADHVAGRVGATLEDFSVRVGPRARRVRLVMSGHDGLIVVVPRGFDRGRVPAIIEANKAWIERARRRVAAQRRLVPAQPSRLPERIVLSATDEEWQVQYRHAPDAKGVGVWASPEELRLVVRGRVEDAEACRDALSRWLARRARAALVPRLSRLAADNGLWFDRVTIRHQRSRWGSCSRRGTISLNARLLFFSPDLVDYVLLHELCHTVEMNHSPRFWRVLEEHCPGSAGHRRRLRSAREFVPYWLDHPEVVPAAGPSAGPSAGPAAPSALPWEDL